MSFATYNPEQMKPAWHLLRLVSVACALVSLICIGCKPPRSVSNQKLIDACANGKTKEAKEALDQGADPNAVDTRQDRGFTVLELASDSPEIEEMLLKAGASPKKRDANGLLPLGMAAGAGDIVTMEQLVKAGAGVNDRDANGSTALALAASQGKFDNALYLVSCGAKLNEPNKFGVTPLMLAANRAALTRDDKDRTQLVQFLVNNGADLAAKDSNGKTALDDVKEAYTAWHGKLKTDPELIKLLTPKTTKAH